MDIRTGVQALAVAVCLHSHSASAGDLIVRAGRQPSGERLQACEVRRDPCVFDDARGDERYLVTEHWIARAQTGRELYRVPIAGGVTRARLAAINRGRSQILIAIAQEAVATSALFTPGSLRPEAVQRQYSLSVRNPKSGAEIKSIDLGILKPESIGLSPSGDYAWVLGQELQLRRHEVRAYNTRSGKLEHLTPLARGSGTDLYESGFSVGGVFYAAEVTGESGGTKRHLSANPYSIAEFTVKVTEPLRLEALAQQPVAVVGFEMEAGDLREMLESALAVKLSAAGLSIVERKRIKELLQEAQFQNFGITDSRSAAELGRMANASALAFGTLRTTGTISLITLRLTGVEDGTVRAAVELECRDCAPDDYLQGLSFLVSDWVQK